MSNLQAQHDGRCRGVATRARSSRTMPRKFVSQPADAKVHGDLLSFSMALWRTGVRVPTRFPKTRVDENPECDVGKSGTVGGSKHVGLHGGLRVLATI